MPDRYTYHWLIIENRKILMVYLCSTAQHNKSSFIRRNLCNYVITGLVNNLAFQLDQDRKIQRMRHLGENLLHVLLLVPCIPAVHSQTIRRLLPINKIRDFNNFLLHSTIT